MTRVVLADVDGVARQSYLLPEWLERIGASKLLGPEERKAHQRLVDSLAAAGDSGALRLQVEFERPLPKA